MNTVKFICSLLFREKQVGNLFVCNGFQEIEVNTCFTPSEVFVSFGDVCPSTGCGVGDDCFDIKIVRHGFILACNVKSNRRKIKWFALK